MTNLPLHFSKPEIDDPLVLERGGQVVCEPVAA